MATIMKVRVERAEELICVDCGATFASHGACDGLEQLCNDCYVAQFAASNKGGWLRDFASCSKLVAITRGDFFLLKFRESGDGRPMSAQRVRA